MEAQVKREREKLIAMVPTSWAREGTRFLFSDVFQTCDSCELRSGCQSSLVKGREYEIVGLRKKTFVCPNQGVEYQVVEARPSRLQLAIPKDRCFEGAVLHIVPHQCERRFCEEYSLCVPEGAGGERRWKVVQLQGTIECPEGRAIIRASVEQVP